MKNSIVSPEFHEDRGIIRALMIAALLIPLHVAEQWFFGFEQAFADVKAAFGVFQRLFHNPDKAVLVTVGVLATLWAATLAAAFRGGKARYAAAGVFGAALIPEAHHPVRALLSGGYYSGTVTGLALFGVGIFLLVQSLREFR